MSYRTALTERLIRILFLLVRRPHSRQELAREFSVSAKTIRRDLDALSMSFPITEEKSGREVRYLYADGYKFKTPVFSVEELATLLLAQKSISGIGITARGSFYADQTDSIIEKIRASLPTLIRENLEVLAQVYGSAQIPEKDFSEHAATIDRLASCAVQRKIIEIRYHTLGKDTEELRRLAPYAVYFDPDGATLKLLAHDAKHDDLRVFNIERIKSVSETDKTFVRPPEFKLETYLEENCFNGIHGAPLTVVLKAVGVTARIFRERKFHPSQRIVEKKQKRGASEETVTIKMRVASGRGLHRFILSYLPDIEVVSPLSLRAEIHEILRAGLPDDAAKTLSAKS